MASCLKDEVQVGVRAWADRAKYVGPCQLCGHSRKVIVGMADKGPVVEVILCEKCIRRMFNATRRETRGYHERLS